MLKPDEREEGATFLLWGSTQLALTVRAVGPGKQPQGQTSEDRASVLECQKQEGSCPTGQQGGHIFSLPLSFQLPEYRSQRAGATTSSKI